MLHEIEPLSLDITYRNVNKIVDNAVCIVFSEDRILIYKEGNRLPFYSDVKTMVEKATYLFQISSIQYYLVELNNILDCYSFVDITSYQNSAEKVNAYAAATAYHLNTWYKQNAYCGCCGSIMRHSDKTRSVVCTKCGIEVFPRISPAVIVAVTNGDKILLTKYNGRKYKDYSLVAGFIEVGETPEQAAKREVMEETGVRIKNIKYYKSQPWGIQSDLLFGFFAELDGETTINMDREELSMAEWVSRKDIHFELERVSLTFDMIKKFVNEE